MSLINQLNTDMKQAMREKDKTSLRVIRMVKAALQNESIKLGKDELSSDEEFTILTRELKQREDSLQEFKEAGRMEMVENLEKERSILQTYMPEQLSDEELDAIIRETMEETGAVSRKDMGDVMKKVIPKTQGKAEGSRVKEHVLKQLS